MTPERREQTSAVMAAIREISCSRCGAVIKPGKKFCSQCGSPALAAPSPSPPKRLRRPNICPECSFENHHSDLFCKGCGAQLADLPVGLAGRYAAKEAPAATPAENFVKTNVTIPPVTGREPTDSRTDVAVPPALQAASAPPPEGPEEVVETDAAVSLAASDQPPDLGRPDSGREAAALSLVTDRGPSQDAGEESSSGHVSADSEVAKPRRPSSRAVGVAVGVGLVVLVAFVHFRRPAKAQGKQFPIATTPVVARGPSPTQAGSMARTDSANQRLESANFNSAVDHGQSRGDLFQPSRALRQNTLENTPLANAKTADVPKVTPTSSAAALTAAHGHPEPAPPSPPRPAAVSDHSSTANGVPSATVSPQTPAPLPELSRQIPAALPSSLPANLPAEINPGPVVSEGPAAPAKATETVQGVQPAKLLTRPALRYPPLALQAHLEGVVHLEANVRADGTVGSVKVVYGNEILSDAAVELVQNSRYRPATVDGRPVGSNVDVVISFRLPR